MSSGPDPLDPSAAALLGDDAYPESQVSYGGATYWLERSADGAKRLVAVAEDESAFEPSPARRKPSTEASVSSPTPRRTTRWRCARRCRG